MVIVTVIIVLVVIIVIVVALSCIFHFLLSLNLQVTLIAKVPLTFTVTKQSLTRPTTF